MTKSKILLAAALLAGSCSFAMAQGGGGGMEGPKPGDAHPPGALNKGGIPPAAAARRGDDMAPVNTGGVAPMGKHAMKKKKHHSMCRAHLRMQTNAGPARDRRFCVEFD